jgi:hypothetical protein
MASRSVLSIDIGSRMVQITTTIDFKLAFMFIVMTARG